MQKHKPAKGRSASNLPGVREIKVWKRACNSGISKHVVRLLDAAIQPSAGLTYCYMEYHQGDTLNALSKAIHKSEAAIMHPALLYHLAAEIALGLMELHSRKILHRPSLPAQHSQVQRTRC
jgi:serine/threonine protein kinase